MDQVSRWRWWSMEPIGTTANCCAPRSTASSSLAQNQVKNIPNICVWTRRMTTNSCAFWCENAAISIIFAVVVKKKQRKPLFLDIVHEGGSLRTPNHNTPETLRLTEPPPRPMLGISGLLNLLTWVEHRQLAQASQHEEGGVPCPIPHPTRLPPPASRQVSSQWEDLPQANRQRLLWLMSHLLERQHR